MSNQVVYNLNGDKLFTYPGQNSYIPSTDINIGSPLGEEIIPFIVSAIEIPNIVTLGLLPSNILFFNQNGMYSINAFLTFKIPMDAITHRISTNLKLKNSTIYSDYLIDVARCQYPASPGGDIFVCQSVNWVGYFNANDGFNIAVINESQSGTITILKADSNLTIARIY